MSPERVVYLVDDDDDMRRSLTWTLRREGLAVETFASAEQLLERFADDRPGCIVADVQMPGMSGLELQRHLSGRGCSTPLVFITGHGNVPMAVRAMEAGAIAFLEKPFTRRELLRSIARAFERDLAERDARAVTMEARRRFDLLSPREREVMARVLRGFTTKRIARELGTSVRTVEVQRASVMRKMQADSIAALVALAVRAGLDRGEVR